MVLRELITKWGFKVDDSGLKKLETGINDVKSSLAKVATIGAAAAGTLFGIAKSAADAGDEIAKTSKALGINAQALQELQFAAQIGGVAQNDFNKSVQKFSKNILEARRGSETYLRTFRALGVSSDVINNKQLKTDQLISILADKFQKLPDGVEKTGLAFELFGRTGPRLLPLLNEGAAGVEKLRAEAQALGGVMGEDLLSDSEEFQDAMLRVNNVIAGIRNEVASKLIPVINDIADKAKDWFLANRELIKQNLNGFIKTLIMVATGAWRILTEFFNVVNRGIQLFGGWERAIRFVSLALLTVFGAQMLIGIGNMASGVFTLIKTFKMLGNASLIASAKAMAIPLLIGAAVVALGLAIEDIISFFNGEDSVTGIIVDKFREAFDWLEEKFLGMNSFVKAIAFQLTMPFRAVINTVKAVSGAIGALSGGDFGGALDAVTEGLTNTLSFDSATSSLGNLFGFGGGPSETTTGSSSSNVTNNTSIEVKVPEGLSPDQAAQATQQGVKEAMASTFREAERAISSPIVE